MAKGRPTDNPKLHRVDTRLDEESYTILFEYCRQENVNRVEAIRRGIKKLKEDLKNADESKK